jgi:hypothetical protein
LFLSIFIFVFFVQEKIKKAKKTKKTKKAKKTKKTKKATKTKKNGHDRKYSSHRAISRALL